MKVSKITRRFIYVIFASAWGSGILFYLLKTFFMQEGDFGLEPHAWQYPVLKVHGAASFLMMLLYGFMLGGHVKFAWKKKPIAKLGVVLMALPAILMITAYLLYYIADEYSREAVALIHLVMGFILPFILTLHIMAHRKTALYKRMQFELPKKKPIHGVYKPSSAPVNYSMKSEVR